MNKDENFFLHVYFFKINTSVFIYLLSLGIRFGLLNFNLRKCAFPSLTFHMAKWGGEHSGGGHH